ncbi:hypothetical protein Hanom_Chr09g00850301 [Helianthus anomalus]
MAPEFRAGWAHSHIPKGMVVPTRTTIHIAGILMLPVADREDGTIFLPLIPATHTSGLPNALRTSPTGQRLRPKTPNSPRELPTPMSPQQNSHSTLGNTAVRPTGRPHEHFHRCRVQRPVGRAHLV